MTATSGTRPSQGGTPGGLQEVAACPSVPPGLPCAPRGNSTCRPASWGNDGGPVGTHRTPPFSAGPVRAQSFDSARPPHVTEMGLQCLSPTPGRGGRRGGASFSSTCPRVAVRGGHQHGRKHRRAASTCPHIAATDTVQTHPCLHGGFLPHPHTEHVRLLSLLRKLLGRETSGGKLVWDTLRVVNTP